MHKSHAIGLVLLLVVLAAAASWFLGILPGGFDAAPPPHAAEHGGPGAAGAAVAEPTHAGAEATVEEAARTAVAAETPSSPNGAALVGRVVDAAGAPVAGATVACMAGLGGGPGGFGGPFGGGMRGAGFRADQNGAGDFDMQTMVQNARTALEQRREVQTGPDGSFRIVPEGKAAEVMLRISARGFQVLDKQAKRPAAADVQLGTLKLETGAVVSGRVLDRNGAPVVAARVSRLGKEEAQFAGNFDFDFPGADLVDVFRAGAGAVTDDAGRFELANAAPGEFSLRAHHPEHPTAALDGLNVAAGQRLQDLLLVADPGVEIRGRVLGAPADAKGLRVLAGRTAADMRAALPGQNGAAGGPGAAFGIDFQSMIGDAAEMMADAGLGLGERSGEPAADGTFVLRGLRANTTYRLWLTQNARGGIGGATCSQRVEAPAGAADVELRYDAGHAVRFQVRAAGSEKWVERLLVTHQLRGGGGMEDMFAGAANFMGGGQGAQRRPRDYAEGRVEIAGLRPKKKQTVTVRVEALGFQPLVREGIALPEDGDVDLGVLEMTAGPVVHVQVRGADGKPVADAQVRLNERRGDNGNNGGDPAAPAGGRGGRRGGMALDFAGGGGRGGANALRSGRTDAAGRCDLNAPAGVEVNVAVTDKDHAPSTTQVAVPATGDCQHVVTLLAGGTVEVTVLHADGKPAPGVRVERSGSGRDVRPADANGVAQFDRLAPGPHRFRLAADAGDGGLAMGMRMFAGRGQDDAGWQTVEVADGARATLQLQQSPTATVHGLVHENGQVLVGARVAFVDGPDAGGAGDGNEAILSAVTEMAGRGGNGGGRSSRTGDDGVYTLKNVPVGQHRLRVTHKNRAMPTTIAVTLAAGDNAIDIDLETTVLRGIVRDPDGNPVAGASVTASVARTDGNPDVADMLRGFGGAQMFGGLGGNQGVKTGDDGSFELRGVQAGAALQVKATAKGFAPAVSAPVTVARGAASEPVELRLPAAGRLEVKVANAAPFTAVTATYDGDDAKTATIAPVVQMLNGGSAKLEGLRPGRWRITVAGLQGGGEPKVVDVVAGQTVALQF